MPALVIVSVLSVVVPLMLRLFTPVTVSAAPVPSTALPVTVSDLLFATTAAWVVMVLPLSVVSWLRVSASP